MTDIVDVTTGSFESDVLESKIPVLLDFHAKWCGPCKAIMPILSDIAKEYDGEVKIVKIDVDEEPDLAKRYAVRGIPTLILLSGGDVKERYSGGMSRGSLSALFERHTGGAE